MKSATVLVCLVCLTILGLTWQGVPVLAASPPLDRPLVARISYADQHSLADLATRLDVWEVLPGEIVALTTSQQASDLRLAGHRVTVDSRLTAQINLPSIFLPGQTSGLPGYPCYRTLAEITASLQTLAQTYPHLTELIDIGDSWAKLNGQGGSDLWLLRLTDESVAGPKPAFFIMAGLHARELTPPELTLRFIEGLASEYGKQAEATWLLQNLELHVLVIANPDGRQQVEGAYLYWRKNTNPYGCSIVSSLGTDLNRNFAFGWGGVGASSYACDYSYRGPSAASEPETQAVQAYLSNLFPDTRGPGLDDPADQDTQGIFMDLHSYSKLVLWPWGNISDPAPNAAALEALGRRMAFYNDYTPQTAYELYPTSGTTDDFAYGELGVPAYTFEMGLAFRESCDYFLQTLLPDNLAALRFTASAAIAPYRWGAGPQVELTSPAEVQLAYGAPLSITALADDGRYPADLIPASPVETIAQAAATIDTPPWQGGAPAPLAPVDGAYNAAQEQISALLDTQGWSTGQHLVYIQAQDSAGNWGPPAAILVTISHRLYLSTLYQGSQP